MNNDNKYAIKSLEIATCFGKCNFSFPIKGTCSIRAEAKLIQNRKDMRREWERKLRIKRRQAEKRQHDK